MARGYSANRSKSGRATLRLKRERSVSVYALKNSLAAKKHLQERQTDNEEEEQGRVAQATALRPPSVRISRMMKMRPPSSIPKGNASLTGANVESEDRKKMKKPSVAASVRAPSMLRGQLAELEEEMYSEMEESEDEAETVARPDVMTKYKAAGRVVDEVLDILSTACVPGANTKDLCDTGDQAMANRLKSFYTKAKNEQGGRIPKGICYPTNVSVDEVLCNHSPLRPDEAVILRGNQVVKLHVGCHIDGYPVSAARTIVVTADSAAEDTSKPPLNTKAVNSIEAARVALLGMVHMLRPGTLNADITDFIARVGQHYEVEAVEGVLSNRTKRWVLDGMDCIIARRITSEDPQQDVGECKIGEQQVWTLDVAFTNNSSYRMTPTEDAVSMFRRTPEDFREDARVVRANHVLTEITDRFFCFPFHVKALQEPLKGKMGVSVLRKHGVLDALPALRTKGNRYITARCSATVAITRKRITVLCGLPRCEVSIANEECKPLDVPADVAEVLAQPLDFATVAALRKEKEGKPALKRTRQE